MRFVGLSAEDRTADGSFQPGIVKGRADPPSKNAILPVNAAFTLDQIRKQLRKV